MKKKTKILISVFLCLIVVLTASVMIYSADYYKAEEISSYIKSNSTSKVTQTDFGYFFDGAGEDKALIFYPGAKVEESAYSPILKELADNGIDCFLLKMPLHLAFLGVNKAERIMSEYNYKTWFLAGHSLGGVAASEFALNNESRVSGLFLLASYPSKDISGADFPVTFIYGSEDSVLNREKLEQAINHSPENSFVYEIKGGNHSGFASYGEQKGDSPALISKSEQTKQTVEAISEIIYSPRSS